MGFLLLGADRFLLSFNLDAETLGIYAIAAFILVSLKEVVSKFFIRVYFSALSHLQNNDGDLNLYYQKSKSKIDAILIALSLVIFLSAESFIGLLYDERYIYAGFILSILSFTILGKSSEVVLQLLLVKGNSKFVAFYNGISVLVCYAILYTGLYFYSFEIFLIMFVIFELIRYISSIFIEYFFIGKFCIDLKKLCFGGILGLGTGFCANLLFLSMSGVIS
ncbi:hypothetical protein LH51_03980 [Nitrincola sp. A-D6]|nr:hypothetical protein LH51_03980 [Nitrincola sp. A-D6]